MVFKTNAMSSSLVLIMVFIMMNMMEFFNPFIKLGYKKRETCKYETKKSIFNLIQCFLFRNILHVDFLEEIHVIRKFKNEIIKIEYTNDGNRKILDGGR